MYTFRYGVFRSPGIWCRRSFRGPTDGPRLWEVDRGRPSLLSAESVEWTRVSSADDAWRLLLLGVGGEYGCRSTWRELMERTGRVGDFQWRLRSGRRAFRSGAISG
jgi:hypothetical protein